MGDEIGYVGAYSGDGYSNGDYDMGYNGSYEAAPLDSGILTTPTYLSDHLSPSSSQSAIWNRTVKHKLEPGELLSQLSSLKSTSHALEPSNSPPINNNSNGFDYVAELEQLRDKIREQEKQIQSLCDDLDSERMAAASAISGTMEMIRRLNELNLFISPLARQKRKKCSSPSPGSKKTSVPAKLARAFNE